MRKASRMGGEKLAMATAIAITQTGLNKSSLPALLISSSPARTVAEVAHAAETLDLCETSAHIAATHKDSVVVSGRRLF